MEQNNNHSHRCSFSSTVGKGKRKGDIHRCARRATGIVLDPLHGGDVAVCAMHARGTVVNQRRETDAGWPNGTTPPPPGAKTRKAKTPLATAPAAEPEWIAELTRLAAAGYFGDGCTVHAGGVEIHSPRRSAGLADLRSKLSMETQRADYAEQALRQLAAESREADPARKVLAQGQGDTPDAAAAAAIESYEGPLSALTL
jgi:hypothetical protein